MIDVPTMPDKADLSRESLTDSLDVLLERYLHLLHEYQSMQQKMAKELSSGYFSLAQANFSNPNRIRYGQDFYDDRMQALTRFGINLEQKETSDEESYMQPKLDLLATPTQQPIREKLEEKEAEEEGDTGFNERNTDCGAPSSDPLKWFGILVPPALRKSQDSFRNAATEVVPSLANVVNEMKSLEIEIRRTRKKIRKAS